MQIDSLVCWEEIGSDSWISVSNSYLCIVMKCGAESRKAGGTNSVTLRFTTF